MIALAAVTVTGNEISVHDGNWLPASASVLPARVDATRMRAVFMMDNILALTYASWLGIEERRCLENEASSKA